MSQESCPPYQGSVLVDLPQSLLYKLTFNPQLKLNSCLSIFLTIFKVRDNVTWLLSHILKETKDLTKII